LRFKGDGRDSGFQLIMLSEREMKEEGVSEREMREEIWLERERERVREKCFIKLYNFSLIFSVYVLLDFCFVYEVER
jgi:hypothetical protein